MEKYPNCWIDLEGYASKLNRGNTNQTKLSENRCNAVKERILQYRNDANFNINWGKGDSESAGRPQNDNGYFRAVSISLYRVRPLPAPPPPPPPPKRHVHAHAWEGIPGISGSGSILIVEATGGTMTFNLREKSRGVWNVKESYSANYAGAGPTVGPLPGSVTWSTSTMISGGTDIIPLRPLNKIEDITSNMTSFFVLSVASPHIFTGLLVSFPNLRSFATIGGYAIFAFYNHTIIPPAPNPGDKLDEILLRSISIMFNNAHGFSVMGGRQAGVDLGMGRILVKFFDVKKA